MPHFPLTIGEACIHRVEELTTRLPLAMFGDPAGFVASDPWLHPLWADAGQSWEMVVQSWIVIVDGRVIVVDPCVGNGRPLPGFALFDQLDTPFIERFAATGIRPEQVDGVFCTHLHSDHCGWNTVLRNGRYVPTFPHARYYLASSEVARWDPGLPGHHAEPANQGVFERSVRPIIDAGLAELIPDDHRISPSLRVHAAAGHTLGHTALQLCSAGREAWFTGDVFHHPLELLHPAIDAGTCEDFAGTLATRTRLIAHFVRTGALIIPAHFAAPHCGTLRDTRQGRVFVPLASSRC